MTDNLLRGGDFVEITSDNFVEQNVQRGRLAYVAGHRALPISEEDPYTQRIKFFVHLCDDEHMKPDLGLYLMDPNSLTKVSEERQLELEAILKQDFEMVVDEALPEDATVN